MTDNEWLKGEVCETNPRIRIRVFGIGSFYAGPDKMPKTVVLYKFDDVEVKLDAKHEQVLFVRKPLQ